MSQEDAWITWSLPDSSEVIAPLFSPWTQDCKQEIKLVQTNNQCKRNMAFSLGGCIHLQHKDTLKWNNNNNGVVLSTTVVHQRAFHLEMSYIWPFFSFSVFDHSTFQTKIENLSNETFSYLFLGQILPFARGILLLLPGRGSPFPERLSCFVLFTDGTTVESLRIAPYL